MLIRRMEHPYGEIIDKKFHESRVSEKISFAAKKAKKFSLCSLNEKNYDDANR